MNILWNTKIEKKTVVTRKKTGKPVKNQKQSSPVKKSAIEIFYLLIFFRPRKGLSLVIGDDDAETDTPRGPGNQKKKEKKGNAMRAIISRWRQLPGSLSAYLGPVKRNSFQQRLPLDPTEQTRRKYCRKRMKKNCRLP